jgi:hypothetical protein
MEKEPVMTVIYKGIQVPAKMVNFGTGVSKLMPINTNRYTLYGIPKPSNLNIDASITATANNIIRENRRIGSSPANPKRTILARYARKGDNASIKGMPVGVVVAFIHDDKLLIGWSKRLEGQETIILPSKKDSVVYAIKPKPKEPLIFTKKDAVLLAIERGLVDTITFRGSIAYTKGEKIIPKSIVNGLDQFIERCKRYFKRDAFNITIN